MICAMPNTYPPVIDEQSLNISKGLATKSLCDYALFVGATDNNYENVNNLSDECAGLKMYLNNTHGPLMLGDMVVWMNHIKNWNNKSRPICVHAESVTLGSILHIANLYKKHIHVCHVSKKEEIELIKLSRENGMNVTCEVSPHHLFMDTNDGDLINEQYNCSSMATVKPPLMAKSDQQALWDNIDIIDCFATDHAPHNMCDKMNHKCPGFPGLETALPLLLTAVKQGKLAIDDIINKYHINPKRIFNLPDQFDTYIEVELDKEWIIPSKTKYTKCDWNPFVNRKVNGIIKKVVLRGKIVFNNGNILIEHSYGKNVREHKYITPNYVNCKNNTTVEYQIDSKYIVDTNIGLTNVHSSEQFNRDMLRILFNKTNHIKELVKDRGMLNILKDKIVGLIFQEPSTRTKLSFNAAVQKLGGKVIDFDCQTSSIQKGESFEDSIKTVATYVDLLVIRSPIENFMGLLKMVNKPIINAGDGIGQHPTQALLDLYTIREELGTINGLTITIVGDLANGRVVHSLVKLLCLYDVTIIYVSPKSLEIPQEIIDYVNNKNIKQQKIDDLDHAIQVTDVLYMTRLQKERFKDQSEYDLVKGYYKLKLGNLDKAKQNMIIMHPFPRVDEIDSEIDCDPRAVYFKQIENGLYVRMALLCELFGCNI